VDVADLVAAVTALRWLAGNRIVHFVVLGALIFAFAHGRGVAHRSRCRARTSTACASHRRTSSAMPRLSDERAADVERRAIEDGCCTAGAAAPGSIATTPCCASTSSKMLLLAEDLAGASRGRRATNRRVLRAHARSLATRRGRAHGPRVRGQTRRSVRIAADVHAAPRDDAAAARRRVPHSRDVRGSRADLRRRTATPPMPRWLPAGLRGRAAAVAVRLAPRLRDRARARPPGGFDDVAARCAARLRGRAAPRRGRAPIARRSNATESTSTAPR
jgi:hypothetical protein